MCILSILNFHSKFCSVFWLKLVFEFQKIFKVSYFCVKWWIVVLPTRKMMVYVFNSAVSFIKFFMLTLLWQQGPLVSFLLHGKKEFTSISFISAYQVWKISLYSPMRVIKSLNLLSLNHSLFWVSWLYSFIFCVN